MSSTSEMIIAELKRDGRASVSEIAENLKISRATVRTHMERMIADGRILGFTVLLGENSDELPIKGTLQIALVGPALDSVLEWLSQSPAISQIHTTHGNWDLVAHFAVKSPQALEDLLVAIRKKDGVQNTETNVFLRQHLG